VGDEIQPGVYRYVGYFARLDDDLEIMDNDLVFGDGLGLMEVYATIPLWRLEVKRLPWRNSRP